MRASGPKKVPSYLNYRHRIKPSMFVGSALVTNNRSLTWDEIRDLTPSLKALYEFLARPLPDGRRQVLHKRG